MRIVAILFLVSSLFTPELLTASEPLASWNDGTSKQNILSFVARVTDKNSPDFVPPAQRIATFDNDGTLWSEQPIYFQIQFALDQIHKLAPQHPEWKQQPPFKAILAGNKQEFLKSGKKGILELMMATHANLTTEEFAAEVKAWTQTARHPRFDRPYTELVYQPMLELLDFLRQNEFKVYIVSGGGIEFMRVFAEEVYGIPPEQVIGSSIKTKFEIKEGKPVIVRQPEIDFIDDKEGKPVAINKFIGRRPIAAFGNSDGDQQMLQWTAAGKSLSFCLIVQHTDAEREWAYGKDSSIGRLDKAKIEADRRGWTVVDMKQDWKTIYPPQDKN